ncbi:MAG TPA: hypothetical protein VHK89_07480 [Actinomycetota bacterium]|nr:hypothetical protein [Actinomycetota bacterium]
MTDARALAGLLPAQRWFAGKGRTVEGVTVVDEATVDEGHPALVFCIARVELAGGTAHMYNVPVLVHEDGRVQDALEDVDRLRLLGELMTHGETVKGTSGVFHFGGPGLDPRSPPGAHSIRTAGVEQTNSSLVLDETVIVKLFRRVEPGPNPDLEIVRTLTSEGYDGVPAHVGEILYEGQIDGDDIEVDLGVAQRFISDARDGWVETLARLHELLEGADAAADPAEVVALEAAKELDDLARLGEVLAGLHVVLAREELDPAIGAEAVTDHDLGAWAQRVRRSLQRLLDEGENELAALAPAIEARAAGLAALAGAGLGGRKARVHGDLHLGQVLATPRGWLVLDFEGEPARPLEERRAKHSPLVDVAGMLRSLNYAASAALFERSEPDSEEWRRLEPWSRAWEEAARQRFVGSYLRAAHEGGFLPPERDALAVMLGVFELDKALYELGYERAHRPQWHRIPLHGIRRILARAEAR